MSNSRENIELRRKRICDLLNERGQISVAEISSLMSVTPVTVRNDLAVLEEEGYLIRRQGGAIPASAPKNERFDFAGLRINCIDEKRAIAKTIANVVQPGDTVFLNSGTTTLLLAEELKTLPRLMVLTNCIPIAIELASKSSFETVLLGGSLNVQYGFMYGGDALEQLGKYQADWCILSVDGISLASGATTYHPEEASVNKMMFAKAKNRIIAADHTKIGRAGFSSICPVDSSYRLVTDEYNNRHEIEKLRSNGLEVLTAGL